MTLYPLIRSILFTQDPEFIHDVALGALKIPAVSRALPSFLPPPPSCPTTVWGLQFRNPVGLAAGFDKNAEAINSWAAMGFGFVEIGTVTPRPQHGNPKPRIHRFPAQRAIVNSMGFPNHGADAVAKRLSSPRPPGMPIGANVGKNRGTSIESAADDYVECLRHLYPHADYFALNISSPNTPGLRHLQDANAIRDLLSAVARERDSLATDAGRKPVVVKIAPDLEDDQIGAIVAAAQETGIDGIVATNTTTDHSALPNHIPLAGGMSGLPLLDLSLRIVRIVRERSGGALPIIGCGGISKREHFERMIEAGASLVQVYTGFVYEGPLIAHHLLHARR
ncbi:MAG TPA: quinone-dependent dihydroorotate dehydrogenase [Verrucomicrobiae bacterium]|nr:quinone-dependent dihydroorotate dehydrogenase [Verrucomicrobiae bacterium]